MLKGFVDRENRIFDILELFAKNRLDFILIGGYAVSAFKHRFSVDADLVVDEKQLESFQKLLKKSGYELFNKKEFGELYKGKFESYKLKGELTTTIDLLINGVACRQTNGFWSYDEFESNSQTTEISGIEKKLRLKIPIKELLIAIKLHSCRLTDVRDIVALFEGVNEEEIIMFIDKGEKKILSEHIKKAEGIVNSPNFKDSFKGVFSLEKLPDKNITNLSAFLKRL